MSSDAPAIPLFGDAYLADTRHLSLEEHGAYLQLMMIAWRSPNCSLPDDDARLARMLGITVGRWAKLKTAVMDFWTLGENGWSQKRLSKERAYVEEKRSKNKSAAEARWKEQPVENIEQEQCERTSECNAPPPPPPITSEPKGSSGDGKRASGKPKAARIPPNWEPGILPPNVRDLAARWPPGRLDRELDGFRDYWEARTRDAARTDWDKVWHNRIRDQHDRIMREAFRNGNGSSGSGSGARKVDGFTAALREMQRFNEGCEDAGDGAGGPRIARMG